MRENCTYGLTRGSRRKTAKSVLRVVEDRAGVPDEGRSALPDGGVRGVLVKAASDKTKPYAGTALYSLAEDSCATRAQKAEGRDEARPSRLEGVRATRAQEAEGRDEARPSRLRG